VCHKEGEGSWGFLILNFEMSEEIAHAKAAKDGKVYRGFIFLGEEIAHAKDAKVAKVGKVMKGGESRRGGWGG
jgi:hypothetical protein